MAGPAAVRQLVQVALAVQKGTTGSSRREADRHSLGSVAAASTSRGYGRVGGCGRLLDEKQEQIWRREGDASQAIAGALAMQQIRCNANATTKQHDVNAKQHDAARCNYDANTMQIRCNYDM